MLVPANIDASVLTESPVRVIDAFIDQLDLPALGFRTRNLQTLPSGNSYRLTLNLAKDFGIAGSCVEVAPMKENRRMSDLVFIITLRRQSIGPPYKRPAVQTR